MSQLKLLFVTGESWFSKIIRWFTWSDWSHVEYYIDDKTVIGSVAGEGVRKTNLQGALKGCTIAAIYAIHCTRDEEKKFKELVHKQVGKPYDYTAIFGILFRRDWQNEQNWFCSELIAYCAKEAGIPLLQEYPGRIRPQNLIQSPKLKYIGNINI